MDDTVTPDQIQEITPSLYRCRGFLQSRIFITLKACEAWAYDNTTESYAVDALIDHEWHELYVTNGCL